MKVPFSATADNTTASETTPPVISTSPPEISPTTSNTSSLSDVERLKLILTEKYEKNLQILYDLLEKAPESLKPAIENAIEILTQGYQQAIANLG
jgi:hypothetical protein